jgi:hypothetical protein
MISAATTMKIRRLFLGMVSSRPQGTVGTTKHTKDAKKKTADAAATGTRLVAFPVVLFPVFRAFRGSFSNC